MMQPLTNLTKQTVAFDWSPDCGKAFQAVKAALSSPPMLALRQLGPDALLRPSRLKTLSLVVVVFRNTEGVRLDVYIQ